MFSNGVRVAWFIASLMLVSAAAMAQTSERQVYLVWMGGADCPPCVAWRRHELPLLQATPVYARIQFFYVPKAVGSAVPPSFFLPDALKPLKDKLDYANSGRAGSPQGALIVDGEVYDYFLGVRSAQEVEAMLSSALDGGPYPFRRCLKVVDSRAVRRCEVHAKR